MSFVTYLKLTGSQQGLISGGCGTIDSIGNRCQNGHEDDIQILSIKQSITRAKNCAHHPITFTKLIDKSSPLIMVAITNNEILTATFSIYRLNQFGALELYYEIKLTNATITGVSGNFPNTLDSSGVMPTEIISLQYDSITASHKIAGTSGYSIWSDNVF